ncbi:hypothetical protein PVAND_017200 [Polypedilum vanderplanki]|uniref:Uncharacterized protein n=1 Tax=Polypedilum vanderplanki TaxID=319348 RepID=A0A9J6BI14_POLVA|nr:hypothetical protein PVAND_017200 [Polypedilum vanderplanki]
MIKTIFLLLFITILSSKACQPPEICQPNYQIQPPYQSDIPSYQPSIPSLNSFIYPYQSSLILNCVFTNDATTGTYDCISTNTTIRTEGTGFYSLDGSHTSNHSNYDVSGLKISSQICHYIPAQLSKIIPRLKKLEITYSGLLQINEFDTNGLRELEYLNLKGNRITELGFRLFKFNPDLISIDFSDNFIKFVADDLLIPFDHMRFIDFSNNLCVKNQPASDNFREWDRELRKNCNPVDKYFGVSEPLWKIAENANLNTFNG